MRPVPGGRARGVPGGGRRRILHQNTCDRAQTWTTDRCQDQATPRLVLRDIAFAGGDANPARDATPGGGSGGAIHLDGNAFR